MKKFTFINAILSVAFIFSCSTEKLENSEIQTINDPNFRVSERTIDRPSAKISKDLPCMWTELMAGQHHEAGTVSVDNDGENLIITYSTNPDWTINLTHLSIGNCDEQSFPTTGSGNPKVGKFEHTEPHSAGTNEVVYMISLDVVEDNYCFAAHAEVTWPTGEETAWANGIDFGGKSWAMYVDSLEYNCDTNDIDEEAYE